MPYIWLRWETLFLSLSSVQPCTWKSKLVQMWYIHKDLGPIPEVSLYGVLHPFAILHTMDVSLYNVMHPSRSQSAILHTMDVSLYNVMHPLRSQSAILHTMDVSLYNVMHPSRSQSAI
ncbi:hypothetical protein CHS0354_026198 [Potamilus streckersoni]|uniref:Uncharacterized protein n=1 Tax=Potamilus streckersoni TaxID=2493646 RepID=A0AAE0VUM9_9BIVA|nr:hypothetical protein CHS0354_026198 [Potamilus streckersoni]